MNIKTKHFIIFLFSLVLLLATPFVMRRIDNKAQMENVKLGYPIAFISQDFSHYDKMFSFFPTWQKLTLGNKDLPITRFYPTGFVVSLFLIFLVLELGIYLLETIDFKIRKLKK